MTVKRKTQTPLVLASASQSRKSLLKRLTTDFKIYNPDIDETPHPNEPVDRLVKRLSTAKAQAAASQYPTACIIGSDQSAIVDQKLLKKPGNAQNAIQQLSQCSGKAIRFYTGLCVLNAGTGRVTTELVTTDVQFRQLTLDEIKRYVQKEEPFYSAGSFHSETLGISLFDFIHSDDPTALMGLPLIRLSQLLRAEGWPVP